MADGHIQQFQPLIDRFGREITYVRLSVTDRCDLRCTYCMAEHMTFLPKKSVLSAEELVRISTAFVRRGVKKLRVSGGEPLVRRDIEPIMRQLGDLHGQGLEELTLTTNGTLLDRHAGMLRDSGVRRINVSLDTLDPEGYRRLTRGGDIDKVLRGLDYADHENIRVKINTVVLKGDNDERIEEIVRWAHGRCHDITLIEVMPLGDPGEDRFDQYFPLTAIREKLEQQWTLMPVDQDDRLAGPSRYVRVAETGGKLGFITPLTNNFCAGCNRVRVTCTGRIYMCLGQDDHVDLRAALRDSYDPAALDHAIDKAMGLKPERHDFAIDTPGQRPAVARHMSVTGG